MSEAYEEHHSPKGQGSGVLLIMAAFTLAFGPYLVPLALIVWPVFNVYFDQLTLLHVTAPFWIVGISGLCIVYAVFKFFRHAPRWVCLTYTMVLYGSFGAWAAVFLAQERIPTGGKYCGGGGCLEPKVLYNDQMLDDPIMLLTGAVPAVVIGYFIGKLNIWISKKRQLEAELLEEVKGT